MTLNERVFRKMGAEWRKVSTFRPGKIGYPTFRPGKIGYPNNYEDEDGWNWVLNDREIGSDVHYRPIGMKLELEPDSDLLPPISSSWKVCIKYLVPFMREKDCDYLFGKYFEWENGDGHTIGSIERKNDNIAEAACKAFMEVEL